MPRENTLFESVYADGCVQGYANALLNKMEFYFPFLRGERKDFLQEMWVEVARAMENYNPAGNAAPGTFACLVMRRRLIKLIRQVLPQKNHEFIPDVPIGTEEDETANDIKPITVIDPGDSLIGGFTVADVQETIAHLPAMERRICEMFLAGQSLNSIRISLNIARTTFYESVLPALRLHFKQLSGCIQ